MKNLLVISAAILMMSCNPAFAGGGKQYEECPVPAVIFDKTDCPVNESVEFVRVTDIVEVETDNSIYILGMMGTGFSSTTGDTDYGDIAWRHGEDEVSVGSDESLRTLAIGYENRSGLFDFYEYGVTTGDSGFRSSSSYVTDLGINARTRTLEAFAQGKKTFFTYGRLAGHGLVGLGIRSVTTDIDESVRDDDPTNANSNMYVTPVARVGLGLSLDITKSVALVARTSWSEELNRGDAVIAHDSHWCEAPLSQDDDGLEATIGVRVTFK